MKNKIFGLLVFKNYRINEMLQITFSNHIRGNCPICLECKQLCHIQCGHVICQECSKQINTKCGICRDTGLVYYY